MRNKFIIRWSESALKDMEEIIDYITIYDSGHAAAHVYKKLMNSIESLKELPERCRIIPELHDLGISFFRELIVRPYRICFRICEKDVVLLAIVDGRRDLGDLLIARAMHY